MVPRTSGGVLGTWLLQGKHIWGAGYKHTSKGKGGTHLFLELMWPMLEVELNTPWRRGVLMCIKPERQKSLVANQAKPK